VGRPRDSGGDWRMTAVISVHNLDGLTKKAEVQIGRPDF
jgi:hypothetical protein